MDNLKDAIGLVGYIYLESTFLFFGNPLQNNSTNTHQ